MNLTNKSAALLGRTLATSLHQCGNNTVMRGAVMDTKNNLLDEITSSVTRCAVIQAYSETLDKLEPLQNGARWTY
jgi:hypothetical protein